MSLPDLAAVLWRQREMLDRLSYRLECEQLLLAAGRNQWLSLATGEVETQLDELRILEVQRAAAAERVAGELGLPSGASLEELAAAAPPPWTAVLVEHRKELLAITSGLAALAETNRHLMSAGLAAVESALNQLGLRPGPAPIGYDARGRADLAAGTSAVVDQAL